MLARIAASDFATPGLALPRRGSLRRSGHRPRRYCTRRLSGWLWHGLGAKTSLSRLTSALVSVPDAMLRRFSAVIAGQADDVRDQDDQDFIFLVFYGVV